MEQKIITQPLTRHSEELRSNVARIFDPNYRLHAFIYTFTNVAWQQQHGSSRVQPVFKSDPAPPKKKKNHANVSYKKPLFCHPGQDFLDPDFKGTAGSCFLQKKIASTTRWTLQVGWKAKYWKFEGAKACSPACFDGTHAFSYCKTTTREAPLKAICTKSGAGREKETGERISLSLRLPCMAFVASLVCCLICKPYIA